MDAETVYGEFLTACATDHERAHALLLAHPALIESRVYGEETPLIFLATEDCGEGVEFLLRNGADANARDSFGGTALSNACVLGYEEMCKTLLSGGADPKLFDENHATPLHKASRKNNVRIIRQLLAAGAVVDAHDICGESPLHYAASAGALEAAIALLDAGANPTGGFISPLDYAKKAGAPDIVDELERRIAQM